MVMTCNIKVLVGGCLKLHALWHEVLEQYVVRHNARTLLCAKSLGNLLNFFRLTD